MITRTFTILFGDTQINVEVEGDVVISRFIISDTLFTCKEKDSYAIAELIDNKIPEWEKIIYHEILENGKNASRVFVDKYEYDDHFVEG